MALSWQGVLAVIGAKPTVLGAAEREGSEAGLPSPLLATAGRLEIAPLLTLDTVPKFVQLIKLVQQQVGHGHERVRAPRLVLEGAEREATLALIADKLATRPANVA